MRTFAVNVRPNMQYVSKIQLTEERGEVLEVRLVCENCQQTRTVNCSWRGVNTKCNICVPKHKWKVRPSRSGNGVITKDDAADGFTTVMELKCFGATPATIGFGRQWNITAENGNVFERVDLSAQWLHNFNGHAAVVQNLPTTVVEE